MKRLVLTLSILLAFALGGVAQSLSFDFEDGTLQGWTSIDADGDGHNWEPSIGGMGHNSNGMVLSYSRDYATGDSLAPNEYLVSPRLVLNEDYSLISLWTIPLDESQPAEHWALSISTTVNDDPMAFTTLQEWTLTFNPFHPGEWTQYSVDLSQYVGQEVYVAIRHFFWEGFETSQSAICIDDIKIDGEIVVAQNSLWKPLNLPGTLLGVNAQGDLFCKSNGTLVRSHDDGETWETVFTSSFRNCTIGNKGRIFLNTDDNINYSDDNGETWQQTSSIGYDFGYTFFTMMEMYSPSNDTLVGWSSPFLTWTLDGGITWDSTQIAMEGYQNIGDLIVNENGDVYVSVYYFVGDSIGLYHSTLSDMHNWELVAFETIGIMDMEFDPEGNVVCGAYYGGEFSGFEHIPGFYAFWANSIAIADNGIVYKTEMTMYNNKVLAYSLDHGEHFYNTIENLPLSEPVVGGEDGFLSKGHDNHLYFFGNDQYWKSIPNANEIPNVISFPSEWYYEILNENGSITYQYMYQAGDTIVNDEPTQILVKINTLYDKGVHEDVTHEYVYEHDGKVYWWNKTLEEFTVLYDLGAEEGDSWVIKVGTEALTMHVDAVEQCEYEGKTYRMLHVSDPEGLFSGDIVCGIGHLTSFFPERLMDNGDGVRVEGLRCYWVDDELVFKYGDKDCDEVYQEYHNGIEEDGSSKGSGTLTIYPNPTHDILIVETFPETSPDGTFVSSETFQETSLQNPTYRITNLMGQTVLLGNITAETQQIDVTELPKGMYFITVGETTRKFVIR